MKTNTVKKYQKANQKIRWVILLMTLLLILTMHWAVMIGTYDIDWANIKALWILENSTTQRVILQIRLPRVVSAVIVGAILSVSGACSQSLMRNPLASPFTLGISSAAAFGAAFAMLFLVETTPVAHQFQNYIIGSSAFLWSLICMMVIIFLSQTKNAHPQTIILSGVVMSSLFGAGIAALQYFANDVQLANMVFWSFGDMGRASWQDIALVSAFLLLGMIFFIRKSWHYNVLKSGDEFAKSLGLQPQKMRIRGMIVASLMTALAVSFYGVIGFVGLLGPHIMRRIVGNNEAYLIPSSAIFGGLLLLLADTFARTILSPIILPVGIITAFLGAPLFIYLLIRKPKA